MLRSFVKGINNCGIVDYYDEIETIYQKERKTITLEAKWLELIRDPLKLESDE